MNSRVLFCDVDTNYREGSTVEWKVPSGTRRLKIIKVLYQPESAGDFHL